MKPTVRNHALVLLTATIAVLAGCTSGDRTPAAVTTPPATSPLTQVQVTMSDLHFAPENVTVAVGGRVTWTNHDPVGHTVTPADAAQWGTNGSGSAAADWLQDGQSWSWVFAKPGVYKYYCTPHASKSGDAYRGMVGTVVVVEGGAASALPTPPAEPVPDVSVVPSPLAPPLQRPGPDGVVHLVLETREVKAKLADGVGYEFWTFGGTVPGPMLRVRQNDRVEVALTNSPGSQYAHSIDLHAVTGPGGGGKVTQTAPGQTTKFTFTALQPGLYVYHCASPHIPSHIANGMYGMILVEPPEGLPKVDREFYIMQGELYTTGASGAKGMQGLDLGKLDDAKPTYYLMDGAVGALTGDAALKARVGETVRLYVGVGTFLPSSFHVIGAIFDKAYLDGGFPAVEHVQTVLIPAGGAAMVEFKLYVPGTYVLVDHALMRALDHGAAGQLIVEGDAVPGVFTPGT